MPNEEIEDAAVGFLCRYKNKYPGELELPICVPDILDCLDDFYVEIDDLQDKYGADILGALFLDDDERRIVVDSSLDPETNPKMLGRYNFTVAHEAGHWVLHAPLLLAERKQPLLFDDSYSPLILCRSSRESSKPERERQADYFAGAVLMPKECVESQWRSIMGEVSPGVNVADEICPQQWTQENWPKYNWMATCGIAKKFALAFSVSATAAQIRLSDLGYITLKRDNQLTLL